ncbi:MAG: hypothetical protein IIW47_01620, partial [Bacteroidales bacterium]|nr:hypothetical protein [Bacteroidales bacterium]
MAGVKMIRLKCFVAEVSASIKRSGLQIFLLAVAMLASFCSSQLYAQYVINGSTPASTRWMQLKGDTYKVVYPQGADSLAKRYLWLLEQNNKAVMLGLGGIKPAKMPVILYNGTANSNGMVVWAPKRMELYTLPMRYSYPIRWDEQLAVHESRHAGQMTHFTKGIYKFASVLLGEQAPSVGVGLYGPRWLLEGDAVIAETELTNSGRGRNAEFMEYYRAAFLEGDTRNWDRWRRGSYKKYSPGLYQAGYLVNGTARYKTGNYEYAGDVLENSVRRFYDFNLYTKVAGTSPKKMFGQGQQMMTGIWKEELARRGAITRPEEVLQKRGKGYAEYRSPVAIGKDSILYIKYSFNSPTQLVLVHHGQEQVLRGMASSVEEMRYAGGKLYFTENVPSSRWSNAVYGRIYSLDLDGLLGAAVARGEAMGGFSVARDGNPGQQNSSQENLQERGDGIVKLSGRGYYKSPDVKGDTLLVEEFFPGGGSAVVLMDGRNGEVLQRIPAPFGGEVTEAVFAGNDIYALAITDLGLGLFKWDGEWKRVIAEQAAGIEDLRCGELSSGEKVLHFVSDIDGVRNVYMLNLAAGKLDRLTNSLYGAGEACLSGGDLYYSSLETGGKFPVKVTVGEARGCGSEYEPVFAGGKLVGNYKYKVAEELSRQAREALGSNGLLASEEEIALRNGTSIVSYNETEEEFAGSIQPQRYSKGGHLFRVHSWAPVYYNVDRIMESDYDKLYHVVSAGATVYSQNTLGTAVSMLGYSYHNGLHGGHFKFKYSGWLPVLQVSADVNAQDRYEIDVRNNEIISNPAPGAHMALQALAYIPLTFNSHGWQRGIVPQVALDFNNDRYYDHLAYEWRSKSAVTAALQFYTMRDRAYSGIFPRWGIGGVAKLSSAVNGGSNFGTAASLHMYGYLPGIGSTHGVKLSFSAQRQFVDRKTYYCGNMVAMPRG